ncbi:MAG: hypothetical protein AAFS10_13610, partial [Myxococcota bacterium]
IVFVAMVSTGIGLFALFWTYSTFFFRPKPDMKEVQRVSFEKSNDPACRGLIEAIDNTAADWRDKRLNLRELATSDDPNAIQKGRQTLQAHIATYQYERRRASIIITKDPNVTGDIVRYIKHINSFLKDMDRALSEIVIAKADAAANPEDKPQEQPKTKTDDPQAKTPVERYTRGWSKVNEDQEKWRVFRQGAIPCGRRLGEVPPVPENERMFEQGQIIPGTAQESKKERQETIKQMVAPKEETPQ